jgi:N utilization substance protein B
LYAWELSGESSLDVVLQRCARSGPPPLGLARAAALAAHAARGRAEFDRRVAHAAEHWRIERVGIVERNIFRLALAELAEGRTPPRVVIDEAVKLAHWFAGAKAPPFVNGVLDRLVRDAGRL